MDERVNNLILKAEQGDVNAMIMAGDCFNRGTYTEKDDKRAHLYYKMAADAGHEKASLMVAIDYLNGIGVNKDKKSGVKYLQFAADHGVAYAQYLLASLYKLGEIGFLGREQKAMKYFEMAARQGDAKSQIELADMIMHVNRSKYTLDDMVFWLVCAYLHGLNNQAAEESHGAMKRLNHLISSGMSGGRKFADEIIEKVKREHLEYLKNPV